MNRPFSPKKSLPTILVIQMLEEELANTKQELANYKRWSTDRKRVRLSLRAVSR